MSRDRPWWVLVAAAGVTYPALALGWCVAVLLGTEPAAWRMGLSGHPAALAAVVLVAAGAVAVGSALWTAAGGLRGTARFHCWVAGREIAVTGPVAGAVAGAPAGAVAGAAAEVGLAGRVRLVAAGERLAVTAGLVRPYVVVSTGLVGALSRAELRAVLAHEQAHLRRSDPLRVLLARVLVAHLWFLPLARDLRGRAWSGFELAADRDAARRYGRSALAGALLRVASTPAGGAVAAAVGFGGGAVAAVSRSADPGLLEHRVSQLESGRPPRPEPVAPGRAMLTGLGAAGFVAVVAGAWVFMLLTCPCEMASAVPPG